MPSASVPKVHDISYESRKLSTNGPRSHNYSQKISPSYRTTGVKQTVDYPSNQPFGDHSTSAPKISIHNTRPATSVISWDPFIISWWSPMKNDIKYTKPCKTWNNTINIKPYTIQSYKTQFNHIKPLNKP